MKKLYRVEWMHNGNWRMDASSSGTFKTKEEAREHKKTLQRNSSGNLEMRILEIEVPTNEIATALMQLPEKSVNVPYIRAQLGQLHNHEIDYIVRAVNAHEELVWQLKSAQKWIERASLLLTPDQRGSCGFHSTDAAHKAIAKAKGK